MIILWRCEGQKRLLTTLLIPEPMGKRKSGGNTLPFTQASLNDGKRRSPTPSELYFGGEGEKKPPAGLLDE